MAGSTWLYFTWLSLSKAGIHNCVAPRALHQHHRLNRSRMDPAHRPVPVDPAKNLDPRHFLSHQISQHTKLPPRHSALRQGPSPLGQQRPQFPNILHPPFSRAHIPARAPRMRFRWRMRVVGLVGMRQHPIRQCGLNRPAHQIRCNHRRNLFSSIRLGELYRHTSRRKLGTGNHRRNCAENMIFRFLNHGIGQFAAASRSHVVAELRHHRANSRRRCRSGLGGQTGGPSSGRKPCRERRRSRHSIACACSSLRRERAGGVSSPRLYFVFVSSYRFSFFPGKIGREFTTPRFRDSDRIACPERHMLPGSTPRLCQLPIFSEC